MRIAKWLIEGGKALVELGDHFFMQQAQLDSLGARREPPKETGEITDTIREAILVARAKSSDEDWLRVNGRRDQECVRYGITREQVAGILAAGTKREKKIESGLSAQAPTATTSPQQAADKQNKRDVLDPSVWNVVPLEKGGTREHVPKSWFRKATEEDRQAVLSVFSHCQIHNLNWDSFRHRLCCARRMTKQQVAGIIAHNQKKTLTAPVAHA